ncbi:MAG: helix-turn-helix domain-containing protein [Candidatus Micrarchaeota archaeon]
MNSPLSVAGLTENEARVYEVLVKSGKTTASRLSNLSGVHRTNAYDIAERLVQKGLATRFKLGKHMLYSPVSPSVLRSRAEKVQEDFDEKLSFLESCFSSQPQAVNSTTFEGQAGLRSVLMDIVDSIPEGGTWYSLISSGHAREIIGNVFGSKFQRMRVAKGIKLVALLVDNEAGRKRAADLAPLPLTETYLLPESFFTPVGTWIYGDKVVFNNYLQPVFSIQIQNKQFAQSYVRYFELMKKKAKKFS